MNPAAVRCCCCCCLGHDEPLAGCYPITHTRVSPRARCVTLSRRVFVVPGRGRPHGHVPRGSHALRLVDRTEGRVPRLRQGNPRRPPVCLFFSARLSLLFTPLRKCASLPPQNNPSNKLNAGTPVTKSHIKKFTACCLALSLTVRTGSVFYFYSLSEYGFIFRCENLFLFLVVYYSSTLVQSITSMKFQPSFCYSRDSCTVYLFTVCDVLHRDLTSGVSCPTAFLQQPHTQRQQT